MKKNLLTLALAVASLSATAENGTTPLRPLRYVPEGNDFVFTGHAPRLYTRAVYGDNQSFRLETSDLPVFAFYSKEGMLGHVELALCKDGQTVLLDDPAHIETRYRAGMREYRIAPPCLDGGSLTLQALALYGCQGALLRVETAKIPEGWRWQLVYGGLSGKRFSRNGDMGVDAPDAFDLKKDYCRGNRFEWTDSRFKAIYKGNQCLYGYLPSVTAIDTLPWDKLYGSGMAVESGYPVLTAQGPLPAHGTIYFTLGDRETLVGGEQLNDGEALYAATLAQVKAVTRHLSFSTPDPWLNPMGEALSMAADAIWESPVFLHGAIGWRTPYTGWRGAYAGDFLGWHERAREHFRAYAASQLTVEPTLGVVMDTLLHLGRSGKVVGSDMYSSGYIGRQPNNPGSISHYDMNLLFIDQLLWHLRWTGDKDFAREMWPVIERHLAWEKRCFDPDNDGLYEAYACIWASDALQYSGGGVTHSTAVNAEAFYRAAQVAEWIGLDSQPYYEESAKIRQALDQRLWVKGDGHWAEYQDLLGDRLLHPDAGLYTIYHAIDSRVGDAFQHYQALRYVDHRIPHLPLRIPDAGSHGLKDDYAVLSTSDWMPYFWSVNDVVVAENLHAALAAFQSGEAEEAVRLLKSTALDNMYLGGSPGNYGQLSFYDAARGEGYRDFADAVGIASRVIVQGLFGIEPDLIQGKVRLCPCFPDAWDKASINLSDISMQFSKNEKNTRIFTWEHSFGEETIFEFELGLCGNESPQVLVNGVRMTPQWVENALGRPRLRVSCQGAKAYRVVVIENGRRLSGWDSRMSAEPTQTVTLQVPRGIEFVELYDPQGLITRYDKWSPDINPYAPVPIYHPDEPIPPLRWNLNLQFGEAVGPHTFFVQWQKDGLRWWQPIDVEIAPATMAKEPFRDWDLGLPIGMKQRCIPLKAYFNDRIRDIFVYDKYLSPRSPYTSMQLPTQGYGDWCGPNALREIDDRGLRREAKKGKYITPQGLQLLTPKQENALNVAFVSKWDNHPDRLRIPLKGTAFHAYLLMAGSTNHQQSHLPNGVVRMVYKDGSCDSVLLVNPETWPPIEQDYYVDGLAFRCEAPHPWRLRLRDGLFTNDQCVLLNADSRGNLPDDGTPLHPLNAGDAFIQGGAATLIDLSLDPRKKLDYLEVECLTIESIIGLVSLTLLP